MTKQSENAGRRKVDFKFKTQPGAKVHVAGTFNDWDPKGRKLSDPEGTGVFSTSMLLKPGHYQYKFVVDGTWHLDPENERYEFGGAGTNSAIQVLPARPPAVV